MESIAKIEKLEIGSEKTCDCPDNHLNCLSAKDWLKNQIGVWQFYYEKRDVRDKNLHPATFPISLAKQCIELFTHKGELVMDPFVGSGTTLIAAKDVGRNAVGFDLQQKYIDLSNIRLSESFDFMESQQIAICDDARRIPDYLNDNTVKLSVTSPPYSNLLNRKRKNKSRRGNNRRNSQYDKIEQYSQDSRDIGILSIKEFTNELANIYDNFRRTLKPNGHVIINVADMWWENERIPIHIYIIQALEKVGYKFRNTIIWDRTNIVNQIGIFGWPSNYITMGTTFEYLLHFS